MKSIVVLSTTHLRISDICTFDYLKCIFVTVHIIVLKLSLIIKYLKRHYSLDVVDCDNNVSKVAVRIFIASFRPL